MTVAVLGTNEGETSEHLLASLLEHRFASRLFAKDATLWGPAAQSEASIRLGWTDFADAAARAVAETEEIRAELAEAGVDRIVLCGMGGSSLAPLVISSELIVLDSTHPEAVREVLSGDLSRTAVVVSSKSGGTIETLSHRAVFEDAFAKAGIDPASRIVIVTDPGSALEASARERGERVVLADPNVGGRFSALTAFGIVPTVLAGADMGGILADAAALREALRRDEAGNPALTLAAAIAAELPEKYLLELRGCDDGLSPHFGLWIEQLVAESTGKDGVGVLPISLPRSSDVSLAPAASVRRVRLSEGRDAEAVPLDAGELLVAGSLGEQFLLWETATAALGLLLGINPFDQPDVEAAKIAARALLDSSAPAESESPAPAPEALLVELSDSVPAGGYLVIQAYASPFDASLEELFERLRDRLAARLGVPVAFSWGPRYLHSTGQMHKGGRALGAFLQFVDTAGEDLDVPGESLSFGGLIAAQARGDANVLRERGRDVHSVVTGDLAGYLRALLTA